MEFLNRINLEIILSQLAGLNNPKLDLEQYQTPANIASTLVYRAALEGDIKGKVVADIGAGNGILGIAAKLLGASKVYLLEVDPEAVELCGINASKLGLNVELVKGDLNKVNIKADTVLMNPPFGSRIRNADIPFIDWAIRNSNVFYMIMNGKSGNFPEKYLKGKASIEWNFEVPLEIPRTYGFHRHERINMSSFILKARPCRRT